MATDDTSMDNIGLPPALLEAPRQFDVWAKKQLLAEQAASTPTVPLYHYTREVSFRGILSGEQFTPQEF